MYQFYKMTYLSVFLFSIISLGSCVEIHGDICVDADCLEEFWCKSEISARHYGMARYCQIHVWPNTPARDSGVGVIHHSPGVEKRTNERVYGRMIFEGPPNPSNDRVTTIKPDIPKKQDEQSEKSVIKEVTKKINDEIHTELDNDGKIDWDYFLQTTTEKSIDSQDSDVIIIKQEVVVLKAKSDRERFLQKMVFEHGNYYH